MNQLSKLTAPAAVAALALVLTSMVSCANLPAKKTVHQPTREMTEFQAQKSAADWDHDADGFYHPTLSPCLDATHVSGNDDFAG
jgi:hypothetical protein